MMALYSRRALLKAGSTAVTALGEASVIALAEYADLVLKAILTLEGTAVTYRHPTVTRPLIAVTYRYIPLLYGPQGDSVARRYSRRPAQFLLPGPLRHGPLRPGPSLPGAAHTLSLRSTIALILHGTDHADSARFTDYRYHRYLQVR